ncbi:MAG: helix-turn-helix domain-containing protein [Bacteroidaceae bacterium]|nr:helix-turn-helix domain-containing protein [Bacteroidaceae bacterium]
MFDLKAFRKRNRISQVELANYLGISNGFISQVELGKSKLPDDKLEKLRHNDCGWVIDDDMMTTARTVIDNNSGVIINGDNKNSSIDNRHFYSDSPDVLRAQIDLLDIRIKEKDAQIKEKDAQINRLLEILGR